MSDASLLPPNATRYERALTGVTSRVSKVPTPLRDLWNPDTCPAELLPWLAWTLGVSAWKPYWSDAVKREQIRQAVEIHRHRGTVQAVRRVVNSFGAALSLREWWESSPVGAPHSFAITLNVNDSSDRSADLQQDIINEITRVKPARSYFTLTLGINADGGMGLQGVSRFAVYRRLDMFEGPFAWRGDMGLQGASRSANYLRLSSVEHSSPIDNVIAAFANGEDGACYIPRPVMLGKQVLFQDQWGREPVTSDGDPVGLMMDFSRRQKRGPELVSDPGFDNASVWVYSAGWNVSNGIASADGSQASSSSMPKVTYDLVQGRMYEVQLEVLSISAGVAQVVVGNHGTIINAAEPGIYKALFVANSTATRTLFFGGRTDFVGSVDNASLKEVYGAHAIQSVSAARPTYRTDGVMHWLEFDGVDDHLTIPGTASTWAFLHDGSDAYASLGMELATENPYQQLAGTADRSVTTSIGMTIGRYASGERYRTTIHNGPPLGSIAADLDVSGYPIAPLVSSTLVDSNDAQFRLNGEIVAADAITSPSTEVATYDFTIGGDGGGASYAALTFFGAVIHEGATGVADTESYLQSLLEPGGAP
uniref:phage tail protein I n=1 Tax=Halomonas sp. TaxID=1486246 RepID=UPI00260841AA|nr:phage tail protein I [Halomonas sp.]